METLTPAEAAACVVSYLRGLSVDQIANGALYYGRIDREQIAKAITDGLDARAKVNERLIELGREVRRYRDRPCVIFGTPSTLAEICRLLGFNNRCTKGHVYLTPTKIQRLGLPLTDADAPGFAPR